MEKLVEKHEGLVTVKEAASTLSCSEDAIWKWLKEGKLQRVKLGRSTRIRQQDLDAIVRLGLVSLQRASGA